MFGQEEHLFLILAPFFIKKRIYVIIDLVSEVLIRSSFFFLLPVSEASFSWFETLSLSLSRALGSPQMMVDMRRPLAPAAEAEGGASRPYRCRTALVLLSISAAVRTR